MTHDAAPTGAVPAGDPGAGSSRRRGALDTDVLTTGDPLLARRAPRSYRATLLGGPSVAGLVAGAVCWHASTVPTLLPRSWLFQGVISALSLLVGYAVGVLGALTTRAVLRALHRDGPDGPTRAQARRILAVAAVVVVALSLLQWQVWQDEQRDLVSMPPSPPCGRSPCSS